MGKTFFERKLSQEKKRRLKGLSVQDKKKAEGKIFKEEIAKFVTASARGSQVPRQLVGGSQEACLRAAAHGVASRLPKSSSRATIDPKSPYPGIAGSFRALMHDWMHQRPGLTPFPRGTRVAVLSRPRNFFRVQTELRLPSVR
jgi:hypothetical protein